MGKIICCIAIFSLILTAQAGAAQQGKVPEKSLFQIMSDTITPIGENNKRTEPAKVTVFQNMSNSIKTWDEAGAKAKKLSLRDKTTSVK
ncbi:MAG: hypothetical protein ABIH57_01125 [Candidatus Omnitrophota bacterium]